jgi:hypothetical protein
MKQELIDKRRGINGPSAPMGGGGTTAPMMDMNQQIPVKGGGGYGQLQRALNTTGIA